MRQVIKKLRREKSTIEFRKKQFQDRQSEEIDEAYHTGMQIAEKWVREASYEEVKDAIKRPDAMHDANHFLS